MKLFATVFFFGYSMTVFGGVQVTTNTRCPTLSNPAILRIEGGSSGTVSWQKWDDITAWTTIFDSIRSELVVSHFGTYRCIVAQNNDTAISNEVWLCCVLPISVCTITHAGITRENCVILETQTSGPTIVQSCTESSSVWVDVGYIVHQRYISKTPITTTMFFRLKTIRPSDGVAVFSEVVVVKPQIVAKRIIVTVHSLYDGTLIKVFEASSDNLSAVYRKAVYGTTTPVVVSFVNEKGQKQVLKKIVGL